MYRVVVETIRRAVPSPTRSFCATSSRTPSIGRRVCALLDREFPSNATWNQRLTLAGWFPTWDQELQARYLLHWTDHEEKLEEEGFACAGDSAPYGGCWQATDFAARLGFPWPFDQAMEEAGITLPPPLPTLGEILEQSIPPMNQEAAEFFERSPLLRLPHALTPEYQLALLADPRVAALGLKEKNPREASESITGYCVSEKLSDRDPLCQRLAAVAAFCDFWLNGTGRAWGWLDKATYEPVYGAYEKPNDAAKEKARMIWKKTGKVPLAKEGSLFSDSCRAMIT